jgi:hypothetical protein
MMPDISIGRKPIDVPVSADEAVSAAKEDVQGTNVIRHSIPIQPSPLKKKDLGKLSSPTSLE